MDIPKILAKIRPSEEWSLNGDDYEGLVWHSVTTKPTLAELEAAWPEVQAEITEERKRMAYRQEADPLFTEWQALLAAGHADADEKKAEWVAKRADIQARFTE